MTGSPIPSESGTAHRSRTTARQDFVLFPDNDENESTNTQPLSKAKKSRAVNDVSTPSATSRSWRAMHNLPPIENERSSSDSEHPLDDEDDDEPVDISKTKRRQPNTNPRQKKQKVRHGHSLQGKDSDKSAQRDTFETFGDPEEDLQLRHGPQRNRKVTARKDAASIDYLDQGDNSDTPLKAVQQSQGRYPMSKGPTYLSDLYSSQDLIMMARSLPSAEADSGRSYSSVSHSHGQHQPQRGPQNLWKDSLTAPRPSSQVFQHLADTIQPSMTRNSDHQYQHDQPAQMSKPSQLSASGPSTPLIPSTQGNPIVIADDDTENSITQIKTEALSMTVLTNTILKVTDNINQVKKQTPIQLFSCNGKTSDRLFAALIEARGLTGKEVDYVNVKFVWSDKEQCLERYKAYSWNFFLRTIRRGWENKGAEFEKNDCEIEVEVHVFI